MIAAHADQVKAAIGYSPNPDINTYEALEKSGSLVVYTIRAKGTCELVGYQTLTISRNPQCMEKVIAYQDGLYVHPDWRSWEVSAKFIRWCGDQLALQGVDELYQYMPTNRNYDALMAKIGYKCPEKVWTRSLQ